MIQTYFLSFRYITGSVVYASRIQRHVPFHILPCNSSYLNYHKLFSFHRRTIPGKAR